VYLVVAKILQTIMLSQHILRNIGVYAPDLCAMSVCILYAMLCCVYFCKRNCGLQ